MKDIKFNFDNETCFILNHLVSWKKRSLEEDPLVLIDTAFDKGLNSMTTTLTIKNDKCFDYVQNHYKEGKDINLEDISDILYKEYYRDNE